jgi:hypothetical protein
MRRHRGRHRAPRRPPPVLARLARPALTVATVAAAVLALAVALRQPPEELHALPPLDAAPPPAPTFDYPPPRPPVVPITSRASEPEEVVTAEKAASPPAAEPPPAPPPKPAPPPPPPASCPTDLEGVRPNVAAAGHHIAARFGVPLSRIGGRAARPGNPTSDHPRGLALDFMVVGSKADRIADYAVAQRARLGVTYVIWDRRIWSDTRRGWRSYSGPTPHTDHVHISFRATAAVNVIC